VGISERIAWAVRVAGVEASANAIWYAASAGLVWLAFYVVLRRVLHHRKINPRIPAWPQLGREFATSLRSILVFSTVTAGVLVAAGYGYTRLYGPRAGYGWGWFFTSIGLAIIAHDTYFYWTHRLMHHPRLFRWLHRTHHLSTNPTPWAAYSFSISEALVQAGIGPLLVCTIPMHGLAFAVFMANQILFNVFGHCGYEIWPRWFLRTWAGRLLNTPTHHALHHEAFHGNYGLYFNVWDRLMGTNHPDYEARFARATEPTTTT
jgi:lathosterol oxidase